MNLMAKAKAKMLLHHVFFAALVLGTKVAEDENCPTAYTDMVAIYYNPHFIEDLNDQDVVLFVLVHEAMHIMLKHGLRMGSRNLKRWNIACDFAINLMLKKAGFKIWKHCCCDDKYEGMSAEQIYAQRENEREKAIKKRKERPRKPEGREDQGTPDNGFDEDNGPMSDDVRSPENMTPEKRDILERTIDQVTAIAANQARMAGKMPAGMDVVVDGALNPPLPWQQLLRNYMTMVGYDDESWLRRNRRFHDVYLPGRYNQRMGEVVMIGDTSASMHGAFAQVGCEMNELMEQVKPERVRVIWADDTDCALEQVFEENEEIVITPKGGGGTDMRKPLEFVERYDPIVVILVTDGYTPWPLVNPPYPLIVVCTTNAGVPIGSVVRMSQ